jgi:outer membrane protein assembly factor BamB
MMNWGKGLVSALAGVMAGVIGLGINAWAGDWPNYRGPDYNGISKETSWRSTWAESPKVIWKASLGIGFSSVTVSAGRVFTTGNVNKDTDVVYCFDAVTGKELWRRSYPCPLYPKYYDGGTSATPTVEGDAVYVFSKNGDVLRLNSGTGEVVWQKNLSKDLGLRFPEWYFASSPLLVDDLVLLNAGTSGIALKKTDGSVVWQSGKDEAGYATAVPYVSGGQKCVVLFGSNKVFGLVAATGKVLWEHPWKTDPPVHAADPIVQDANAVFISSGYGHGCALLKIAGSTVTEAYNSKAMKNMVASSVLWKGALYGFDGQVGGSGKLVCLDFITGQVKWSQAGMGTGSLMLADGKLIILSEAGKLVIAGASPDKFEELASAQVLQGKCWTVPVLANGRIYCRNSKGDVVAVDVRRK